MRTKLDHQGSADPSQHLHLCRKVRTKLDHLAYLEEWKANCDLSKHQEDVKQKRFNYFLTIQFAFIALFGVIGSSVIDISVSNTNLLPKTIAIGLILLALCLIAIMPLYIAWNFRKLDSRARDYVDIVKGKLLIIEAEWQKHYPDKAFTTFTEQFSTLVHKGKPTHSDWIEHYKKYRDIEPYDRLSDLTKSTTNSAAHKSEERLVGAFVLWWIIWLVVTVGAGGTALLCHAL